MKMMCSLELDPLQLKIAMIIAACRVKKQVGQLEELPVPMGQLTDSTKDNLTDLTVVDNLRDNGWTPT